MRLFWDSSFLYSVDALIKFRRLKTLIFGDQMIVFATSVNRRPEPLVACLILFFCHWCHKKGVCSEMTCIFVYARIRLNEGSDVWFPCSGCIHLCTYLGGVIQNKKPFARAKLVPVLLLRGFPSPSFPSWPATPPPAERCFSTPGFQILWSEYVFCSSYGWSLLLRLSLLLGCVDGLFPPVHRKQKP